MLESMIKIIYLFQGTQKKKKNQLQLMAIDKLTSSLAKMCIKFENQRSSSL